MTSALSVMLEMLGRWIPGFDPATGVLTLPPWASAAGAVVVGVVLLFILARVTRVLARVSLAGGRKLLAGAGKLRNSSPSPSGSRRTFVGVLARAVVLVAGAGAVWYGYNFWTLRELAAERHDLDARAFELTSRALMPGSALACLDAGAGDTVEASCERALFATPEATASAVAFATAQLALLADGTAYVRRDPSYAKVLTNLQRTLQKDRFGLVAHALSSRDGCTLENCRALALLADAGRVRDNLANRSYDFYVMRHASGWPAIERAPSGARAQAAAPAPESSPSASVMVPAALPNVPADAANAQASARPAVTKIPGPNVFFPSAASIPPVSIMNNEPGPPTSEPAPAAKPTTTPPTTPTPPRRPAAATAQPPARRPADAGANANANAAARPESPAPTQ